MSPLEVLLEPGVQAVLEGHDGGVLPGLLALAAELVQAVLLVWGQLGVQLGLGAAPDGVLPGEPPLPPPLGGGLPHGLVQFGGEETALHGR